MAQDLNYAVSSALVTVCQQVLTFNKFIKLSGELLIIIDDLQGMSVTVNETITSPAVCDVVADICQITIKNEVVHLQLLTDQSAENQPITNDTTEHQVNGRKRGRGRPKKVVQSVKTKKSRSANKTRSGQGSVDKVKSVADIQQSETTVASRSDHSDGDVSIADDNEFCEDLDSESTETMHKAKDKKCDNKRKEKKCFSCVLCDFTTDQTGVLKRHVVGCHGNKMKRSTRSTEFKESFISSLTEFSDKIKNETAGLVCTMCDEQLCGTLELQEHVQHKHNVKVELTVHECKQCFDRFITSDQLQDHTAREHAANTEGHTGREHAANTEDHTGRERAVNGSHETTLSEHSSCDDETSDAVVCKRRPSSRRVSKPMRSNQCDVCGEQCSNAHDLQRHIDSHSRVGRRVSCDKCDKSFTTASTLYHHKRAIHSGEKPYQCELCHQSFNFHHSLKMHTLKHSGERAHKCPMCCKSYYTASHLKHHIGAIHSDPERFVCITCGKTFPYLSSFKMHEMIHRGERPFTCTFCGKSYVTIGALREHEQQHTTDSECNLYRCQECPRSYRTPGLLYAHQRRHTSAVARVMCEVCGRMFMYRSNLKAHSAIHSGQRTHSCSICQKTFKTYATLYSHRIVHQNDLENTHVCSICGKAFKTRERLRAHEVRHTDVKAFSCEVCKNSFLDRGGLSKHIKSVHSVQPRYACPSCGKISNRLDNLRVHMRSHSNPRLLSLTVQQLMLQPPSTPVQNSGTVSNGATRPVGRMVLDSGTVSNGTDNNVPNRHNVHVPTGPVDTTDTRQPVPDYRVDNVTANGAVPVNVLPQSFSQLMTDCIASSVPQNSVATLGDILNDNAVYMRQYLSFVTTDYNTQQQQQQQQQQLTNVSTEQQ